MCTCHGIDGLQLPRQLGACTTRRRRRAGRSPSRGPRRCPAACIGQDRCQQPLRSNMIRSSGGSDTAASVSATTMISATGRVWSSTDCTARPRDGRPIVGITALTVGVMARPVRAAEMYGTEQQRDAGVLGDHVVRPRRIDEVPDPLQRNRYDEWCPLSRIACCSRRYRCRQPATTPAGVQPARRPRPRNPTGSSASRSSRWAATASRGRTGTSGSKPIRTARCSAWVYKSGVRFMRAPPAEQRAFEDRGDGHRRFGPAGQKHRQVRRVLLDRLALQGRSEQSGPRGDRHHVREHQPEHDDPGELPPTPDPGTQDAVGEQGRRGEQTDECVRPEVEAEAGQPEQSPAPPVARAERPAPSSARTG